MADRGSILERQRLLILRPVDDVEEHSAPEHLAFEVAGVLLPVGRLADPESRFLAPTLHRVIGRQGAPDAFVHHRQAGVRERLIVHGCPAL